MSEGVTLLSSHDITHQELADVLREAGGAYDADDGSTGQIWRGEQTIWVFTGKESLREFLPEYLEVLAEDNPARLELIRTKLGGEPQAYMEIEISRTPGSGLIAVDFACRCVERWPCVVVDSHPPTYVYSQAEILRLCEEGKGFIDYGM